MKFRFEEEWTHFKTHSNVALFECSFNWNCSFSRIVPSFEMFPSLEISLPNNENCGNERFDEKFLIKNNFFEFYLRIVWCFIKFRMVLILHFFQRFRHFCAIFINLKFSLKIVHDFHDVMNFVDSHHKWHADIKIDSDIKIKGDKFHVNIPCFPFIHLRSGFRFGIPFIVSIYTKNLKKFFRWRGNSITCPN